MSHHHVCLMTQTYIKKSKNWFYVRNWEISVQLSFIRQPLSMANIAFTKLTPIIVAGSVLNSIRWDM